MLWTSVVYWLWPLDGNTFNFHFFLGFALHYDETQMNVTGHLALSVSGSSMKIEFKNSFAAPNIILLASKLVSDTCSAWKLTLEHGWVREGHARCGSATDLLPNMSEFALQNAVAPLIACNFIYLFAQTTRNGAKSVLAYLALPEKA